MVWAAAHQFDQVFVTFTGIFYPRITGRDERYSESRGAKKNRGGGVVFLG